MGVLTRVEIDGNTRVFRQDWASWRIITLCHVF
jgi:hypothetical protein